MKKTLLTFFSILCFTTIIFAQPEYDFGPEQTINTVPTGGNPYVIASGDLTNDGDKYMDIVIGTYTGNTIEIYTNDGDGTFTLQTPTIALSSVTGIHVANIDGNPGLDIIASSYLGDRLVWYANDGSGGFTLQVPDIATNVDSASQVSTADINKDGNLDIILVVYGFDSTTDRVVWYPGNGDGTFGTEQVIEDTVSMIPASNSGPGSFGITDLDGDTDLDIVIGYTDAGNIEIFYNQYIESAGAMTVSWEVGTTVHSGDDYLFVTNFADYNDDGTIDIIKTDIDNTNNDDVSWYDGSDSYKENAISYSMNYPGIIVPTDLNKDGYSDFLISNGATNGNDIILLQSSGQGTYYAEKVISVSQKQVFGITINDFNGDDLLDIASIDYQDEYLNWFENLGVPLGVNDNSLSKISIYPNPTTNKLYIKSSFNENFKVSVFDILGKKIMAASLKTNNPLDVSQLHNGIYFIRFDDYNTTFKFIKK